MLNSSRNKALARAAEKTILLKDGTYLYRSPGDPSKKRAVLKPKEMSKSEGTTLHFKGSLTLIVLS